MKRRSMLSGIVLLFLSVINFVSCSNEVELGDEIKIIKITVSAQTGFYKSGDVTQDIPIEGMNIKEGEKNDWYVIPFSSISDFKYEEGYDYELLVEKVIPADSSSLKYKLIKLLKKEKAIGDTKMIEVYISDQTGLYKSGDLTQDIPSIEGMRIKEGEKNDWYVVPFNKIIGFKYKKGYSYKLLVEKTALIDVPIYINSITYKLMEILSMEKMNKKGGH